MKFSKFVPIPLIVASLAFTLVILDQLLTPHLPIPQNLGFGWIAFITWSLYFAAGGELSGGLKVFYAYVYGVAAAVCIVAGSVALSGMSIAFFAAPIAIFLGVAISLLLERVPPLDNIPAIFIAAATFFAIMTYVPGADYASAAIIELIYCVFGLAYGWISVQLRSRYEAWVTDGEPADHN